jgi:hypothetical protein
LWEHGGVWGAFEAGAAGAEQFYDFVFDDGDEPSGGSCSGGEFRDAPYLVDFSSTRGREVLASAGAGHELTDDESDDEEDDGGLEFVVVADGE